MPLFLYVSFAEIIFNIFVLAIETGQLEEINRCPWAKVGAMAERGPLRLENMIENAT